MSTSLTHTIVAHGRLPARFFAPDNQPGDWQRYAVTFPVPFPADDVRVVAMASADGVDAGLNTVPAVPVITDVTRTGFVINARNSDCASGSAGMHWIAFLERPGVPSGSVVDVRTAVLHSRFYGADCTAGDWNGWVYSITNPLPAAPTVVASPVRDRGDRRYSATTFGAFVTGTTLQELDPTPVPVATAAEAGRVALAARNGGGWPGSAGMNFVAVAPGGTPPAGLVVDTGATPPVTLPPTGGNIHQRLEVNFALPFATPPVVLVTASGRGLPAGVGPSALVGLASAITTHGFVIEAMNTDSVMGSASFTWVALGCGVHCGAGTPATVDRPPVGPRPSPVGPLPTPAPSLRPSRSASDS